MAAAGWAARARAADARVARSTRLGRKIMLGTILWTSGTLACARPRPKASRRPCLPLGVLLGAFMALAGRSSPRERGEVSQARPARAHAPRRGERRGRDERKPRQRP